MTENTMNEAAGIRELVRSVAQDVSWGGKSFLTNSVAGSPLCPRALRYGILRMRGFDVRTPKLQSRCTASHVCGTQRHGHRRVGQRTTDETYL